MNDLTDFLAEAAARPLEWGRCDCSLMVAAWIARRCGVHPAMDLAGRYADEAGAKTLVAEAGGLVALFRPRLAAIGLVETEAPRPRDVAIVAIPRVGEFGAIRAAGGWAVKTTRGLVVAGGFRPVVTWRVEGAP